jgi:hypothetical protein
MPFAVGPGSRRAGASCTYLLDPVDWDDDVRIAIEERASLSPDALTGMEASLRFGGAENCDSKIFGRLSAWQNWIFTRPNATGDEGALTRYGAPESAKFDWTLDAREGRDHHEHRRPRSQDPNNVGLRENKRLMMALEKWQPKFLEWWANMGPTDFNDKISTCARRSASARAAGPTTTTSRCPTTAGASSSPTARPIARSTSATSSAKRPGTRCPASSAIACAA